MKSRLQAASTFLLIALVLSFVPAAAYPSSASAAQACTDRAQFVADITVPDGTRYDPGAAFTKTWRLRNVGTCTWTTSYAMVFDSGTQMGSTSSVPFHDSVAPGGLIDLAVNMTAPSTAGHYIGYWKFKNASGMVFGIGINANRSWWVEINVVGSTQTGVVYDFVAKAGDATWSSGAGGLSFPGTNGDVKGFALKADNPTFESGVTASKPGLLFSPQQITNGFIQAVYTDFTVQSGDRFQTTVGCEINATSCYVAYRLDYQVGSTIRTFWSFRERYEGLTFSPNLDLSPLAGQTVKFILYVSAFGSPVGDFALWGSPVIVRKGATGTPTPTVTPGGPTATPTGTVPPSSCDRAQFIADVNFPDGTIVAPGSTFTKTWRLKNVGNCAWSTSYQLVFFSGEQMGAATSAAFPKNVAVGQTVDISINLTAPSAAGSYRGFWMFKNANGAPFGIGAQANKPWWVDIRVSGPTVTPGGPTGTPTPTGVPSAGTAYDFVAHACDATWYSRSSAGTKLPCPGTDGDVKGFVLKVSSSKLETGATDPRPGLITFPSPPQPGQDGYIQGFFPPFRVQSGDRFRSTINCEGGANLCYVAFRLDYQTGTGPITTIFGPFLEKRDSPPRFFDVDVDLTPLAGKDVKFILTVLSAGTNIGDRALWVGPIIFRPGATQATATATGTPTATATATATGAPTATPTATSTPTTSPANTYLDTKYNFKFTLPEGASIVSQSDTAGRVDLPIVSLGTNLTEKYIMIHVAENANPCVSPDVGGTTTSTENVTVNNIPFVKTMGQEGAAGNRYDWTVYATTSNNACITLAFILRSANVENFPTPPPVFDQETESVVFGTVISTYNKINP